MDNKDKYLNKQYVNIVRDILYNDEFEKMSNIVHHGLDRKSHSLRVSYYSYKICKMFGLDYVSSARAGLLHDFFFEDNKCSDLITRAKTLVNHPKYALNNSNKLFYLNNMEKDIIESHMFPISIKPPKYIEGWVVNLVDDVVAIAEIGYNARSKITYALNFIIIFVFAYFR